MSVWVDDVPCVSLVLWCPMCQPGLMVSHVSAWFGGVMCQPGLIVYHMSVWVDGVPCISLG